MTSPPATTGPARRNGTGRTDRTGRTGSAGNDTARTGTARTGTARSRPRTLLDASGRYRPHPGLPVDLPDGDLLALYRHLVTTRRLDREAVALQRQGELGAYPPNLGQEAAQVGPAYALGEQDWLFPAYRELGALLVRGVPATALLHVFRGTWHSGHDPADHRVAMLCLPIATQTLHATGFAMGAALAGDPAAVLTFLGDGATSEGDAHEAFNFAAVFCAPIVFVIQNNQYAISVPVSQQAAAPSLAARAAGYGMWGISVDGNDVLACYAATRAALSRARRGEGPAIVEAVTYRMDGHSTADDWTRYRSQQELDTWAARDPLTRLETWLRARGVLTGELTDRIAAGAEKAAAAMRAGLPATPDPAPAEMFEHAYVNPPPVLARQRAQLAAELAAAAGE